MIGIVIPVFNRLLRLQRAVQSVLDQSIDDFELVVVDDASTVDLSSARSQVETAGHRWLTLESNSGPATARNAGVAALSEEVEWLAFLDSDDSWEPDKLERQLDWHRRHPESRISQCQEVWMRNGSPAKRPQRLLEPEGEIFADCVERCCISPSAVMLRPDLFEEFGGFDESYRVCEDYQLWLRIALGYPVGLLREPLVTKNGGADDQLTATVPAFDRWRLRALSGVLMDHGNALGDQREALMSGIAAKARILERGAHRHRDANTAGEYAGIAEWAEGRFTGEALSSRHRDFIEDLGE